MTKGQAKPKARLAVRRGTATGGALSEAKDDGTAFAEVVGLIRAARQRSAQAVNTVVVDLYWHIGQYLHHKIEADGWAKGTVVQLAGYVSRREPGKRGFSAQNLWRMRQFYQAYPAAEILSTLLRELPWSSHLHILSRTKRPEEREFYLRMAAQQRWQVREVARQIDTGLFERAVDVSLHGQGRGAFLLMDALHRSWQRATEIAAMAVVVDAKDEAAAAFYQHFDFTALQRDPRRLYLSTKKVAALFR